MKNLHQNRVETKLYPSIISKITEEFWVCGHKCVSHTNLYPTLSCVTTSCVWARGVMTSCVWASCARVPRPPRETKMDVSKCHACHDNSRGILAPHLKPSAPPEPAQCHKSHACHARVSCVTTSCVWASGVMTSCARAPRLPRETKMDVATPTAIRATATTQKWKSHACHVKRRWMSPSATPATPTAAASRCHT